MRLAKEEGLRSAGTVENRRGARNELRATRGWYSVSRGTARGYLDAMESERDPESAVCALPQAPA